jgi:hypothetical protein
MDQLFAAMLEIAALWIGLFAPFTGIGLLIRRCWGKRHLDTTDCFVSFWVGWAATIALLQVWNIFLRVSWRPGLVVAAVGLTGLALCRRELWRWLRSACAGFTVHSLAAAAGVVLLTLWLANQAVSRNPNPDQAYHDQTSLLATLFHTLPGIGNLHGRLAFNNSSFLYLALLRSGIPLVPHEHLCNSLLLWVLLLQAVAAVLRLLAPTGDRPPSALFLFTLTPWLILTTTRASDEGADLTGGLLCIVLAHLLLRLLEERDQEPAAQTYTVASLTFLSAALFTVKLSFVPVGGVTSAIAFGVWWVRRRNGVAALWLWPALAMVAGGLLLLVPWMVRGVIMSGYIAYPFPYGRLPVDWRIPHAAVVHMNEVIRAIARQPDAYCAAESLDCWDWLAPWGKRVQASGCLEGPVALLLLALCFALLNPNRLGWQRLVWVLGLLPSLAGICFWFVTAPDPRFIGPLFFLLAAAAVALTLHGLRGQPRRFQVALFITLIVVLLQAGNQVHESAAKLRFPNDNCVGMPHPQLHGAAEWRTNSGLVVLVPEARDLQRIDWANVEWPLLATYYFDPKLALRDSNDLSRGFKVEPFSEKAYTGWQLFPCPDFYGWLPDTPEGLKRSLDANGKIASMKGLFPQTRFRLRPYLHGKGPLLLRLQVEALGDDCPIAVEVDGERLPWVVPALSEFSHAFELPVKANAGEIVLHYATESKVGKPVVEFRKLQVVPQDNLTSWQSNLVCQLDVRTGGNWPGVYGKDGYCLPDQPSHLPDYARLLLDGPAETVWAASSDEVRAPRRPRGKGRGAACWDGTGELVADLEFIDGKTHQVSLYFLDWDSDNGRVQTVELLDADTGQVLDRHTLERFRDGIYLVWQLKGHVQVRVTPRGGHAVLSGMFFQ